MLYHFLQGYADAIYVAVHLRTPKDTRQGLFPEPAAPIEAQVATCLERLFGVASRSMRVVARLLRRVRSGTDGSTARRAAARTLAVLLAGTIVGALAILSREAGATVLTFDQARSVTGFDVIPTQAGATMPQDYGDRVTGSPMDVSGGSYTYGNSGEGFTPNVGVNYLADNGVSLWTTQYGDLTNVIFAQPGSNALYVQLEADPGFEVVLYGFDLAGWLMTDYIIGAVTVTGDGTTLFSQDDVLIEGDPIGPGHTAFNFAAPLMAADLLIGINFANIAASQQDNIGIDNIRFGQSPPPEISPTEIPEPGSLALFGAGLTLLVHVRRRAFS